MLMLGEVGEEAGGGGGEGEAEEKRNSTRPPSTAPIGTTETVSGGADDETGDPVSTRDVDSSADESERIPAGKFDGTAEEVEPASACDADDISDEDEGATASDVDDGTDGVEPVSAVDCGGDECETAVAGGVDERADTVEPAFGGCVDGIADEGEYASSGGVAVGGANIAGGSLSLVPLPYLQSPSYLPSLASFCHSNVIGDGKSDSNSNSNSDSDSYSNRYSNSNSDSNNRGTFTCPICLSEYSRKRNSPKRRRALADEDRKGEAVKVPEALTGGKEEEQEKTEEDEGVVRLTTRGIGDVGKIGGEGKFRDGASPPSSSMATPPPPQRSFELSACGHVYCAPCLRAYVRSELGERSSPDIPCCHLPANRDGGVCGAILIETDVHEITHARDDEEGGGERMLGPWKDGGHAKASDDDNDAEAMSAVWKRYQQIRFDARHGRDNVRRCPNCDEARVFDADFLRRPRRGDETIKNHLPPPPRRGDGGGNVEGEEVARAPPWWRRWKRRRLRDGHGDIESDVHDGGGEEAGDRSSEENKRVPTMSANPSALMAASDSSPLFPAEADADADDAMDLQSTEEKGRKMVDSPDVKSTVPVVHCLSCSTEFCYHHSNAHTGRTCSEYEAEAEASHAADAECARVMFKTKPCPGCNIPVSKEGGCNQIRCPNCAAHFCWLCGVEVDDGAFPEHFQWWNVGGCPNMQLDESEDPKKCTIYAARLLSILQLIIVGPPSVVLALLTMLICPCTTLRSGRRIQENLLKYVSFWGACLFTTVSIPFVFLATVVMAFVFIVYSALVFVFTGKSKARNPASATQAGGATGSVELRCGTANEAIEFNSSLIGFPMTNKEVAKMEEGKLNTPQDTS